jgi:inosine-uridine nucleoside N-ribohydrolase
MSPASSMTSETQAVLLDTDIGTNIDDALCLSYLLCQPRCRLLGVTTVGGKSARRADLARALCNAFGRHDIPVLAGMDPAGSAGRATDPWQAESAGVPESGQRGNPGQAVRFLARVIENHPEQITLISIGPLTNLARLLSDFPDAGRALGSLVSMCGLYGDPPPGYGPVETNLGADPEAAAVVFGAGLREHLVLGLETTGAYELPADEVAERLRQSVPPLLSSLLDAWRSRERTVRFHDPLAAGSVFVPELFSFEPARCAVRLEPGESFGRTAAERAGVDSPHRLLRRVEFAAFVRHLFEIVG